ncbi:MAG TPA: hypothetical protein VG713_12015 [Pirellulales bacterium]|nr:hypothetical protein [Pirellulales bacterium]
MAKAEELLVQALAEIERSLEELKTERQLQTEELRERSRQLAEAQQRQSADLVHSQEALRRQAELIDQRRAALDQSRLEVTAMHREMLELRLANEELWVQLSGAVPAAVLSQTLAETRSRLADQYRLAEAELEARRTELRTLRADLAAEHDRLRRQAAEIEAWMSARVADQRRRETEVEGRHEELLRQKAEYHRQRQTWRREQHAWQRQRLDALGVVPPPIVLGEMLESDLAGQE